MFFSSSEHLRQVFLKILSLRRTPRRPDSEQFAHFTYRGFTGLWVTQGGISHHLCDR
ncbi:hypothetical protein COMA2_230035 [Candidatus Nitrospira nitrificans]|uniref:Uncharacterized protein n=1 Tax=Candidatus Nitrospira nitrificans TaxID=1742973 RepID=A0A0S4LHP0_9BACT|nr:hypothetical protein COMA2_230035 [Candidatus Nitrospira nitrificans]